MGQFVYLGRTLGPHLFIVHVISPHVVQLAFVGLAEAPLFGSSVGRSVRPYFLAQASHACQAGVLSGRYSFVREMSWAEDQSSELYAVLQ
jgi:hypothetical protein